MKFEYEEEQDSGEVVAMLYRGNKLCDPYLMFKIDYGWMFLFSDGTIDTTTQKDTATEVECLVKFYKGDKITITF